MEARENKLTKADIIYMLAMVCICISLIFLHLKYINIICVMDVISCVLTALAVIVKIFKCKVNWLAVGFGKKVIVYNAKKIDEQVNEYERR